MDSNQDRMDSDLERQKQADADANRDPITGEAGAHPVGTGMGAAVAGTIGAAVGAPAGPLGAALGAVIGSVVGGLVGKSTAEAFDPTIEEAYWRDNYRTRPYVKQDLTYEDYHPAYRTGYEGYQRYSTEGRPYHEIESDLQRHYETEHRDARVGWNDARYAAQDAWNRAHSHSVARTEDEYWQQHYASQPYYESGLPYERYQPAYRVGYEGFNRYRDDRRTFDEVEPELRRDYESKYGTSGLGWEKAKYAVRDAWNRVERAVQHH